jgi:hypothetical protein
MNPRLLSPSLAENARNPAYAGECSHTIVGGH